MVFKRAEFNSKRFVRRLFNFSKLKNTVQVFIYSSKTSILYRSELLLRVRDFIQSVLEAHDCNPTIGGQEQGIV